MIPAHVANGNQVSHVACKQHQRSVRTDHVLNHGTSQQLSHIVIPSQLSQSHPGVGYVGYQLASHRGALCQDSAQT